MRSLATTGQIMATESGVARIQGAEVNVRWMREIVAYGPTPTLSGIGVPVLAMTGSKDIQVDPEDIGSIAAILSSAQTHVLADVDHILRRESRQASDVWGCTEQAAEPIDPSVAKLLLDWLARLPRGSSRTTGDRAGMRQGQG